MARFSVFLDSNIFIRAKYSFADGPLSNLKKHCDHGGVALFTNDIIINEVRNHIHNDVDEVARKAKNSIKNHPELVHAISPTVYESIKDTILNAPAALASQYEQYMRGATVLPIDGLSMASLFTDYFQNTAPFEKNETKKHEFPDAVAIMSIKRYLEENSGSVLHVVTDDGGWHNALSSVDGVVLYKSVHDLLNEIAKQEKELYARISQYMGDRLGDLQDSAWDWIYAQDWSSVVDNIEMCIECTEIDDLRISEISMAPNSVDYIDTESDSAVVGFSGLVKMSVDFPYTDHTSEIYDREDHSWYNTIYGNGSADIEFPFAGAVTVMLFEDGTMDFEKPAFEEIDIHDVEIIYSELKPYREDDEPYFTTCPGCGKPIGIHNDGGNSFCTECAPHHDV